MTHDELTHNEVTFIRIIYTLIFRVKEVYTKRSTVVYILEKNLIFGMLFLVFLEEKNEVEKNGTFTYSASVLNIKIYQGDFFSIKK